MKTKKIVDTNLLIRFLVDDNQTQAKAVTTLIEDAQPREIIIPDLIIAEVVWVLQSFYKVPKHKIVEIITSLLATEQFSINQQLIGTAVSHFAENNISFVDAYLIAYTRVVEKSQTIYSFDKGLDTVAGIERIEP